MNDNTEQQLKRLTKAEMIDIILSQRHEIRNLRIDKEEHHVYQELEQHIALARGKRKVQS